MAIRTQKFLMMTTRLWLTLQSHSILSPHKHQFCQIINSSPPCSNLTRFPATLISLIDTACWQPLRPTTQFQEPPATFSNALQTKLGKGPVSTSLPALAIASRRIPSNNCRNARGSSILTGSFTVDLQAKIVQPRNSHLKRV